MMSFLKNSRGSEPRLAWLAAIAGIFLLAILTLVLGISPGVLGLRAPDALHSIFFPLALQPPNGPSLTPTPTGELSSAIVIDGPWDALPTGAGLGLAVDSEMDALTMRTVITNMVFVLQPDPSLPASANAIRSMQRYEGRLYLGYGDFIGNAGPVDILSYSPQSGMLHREMEDVPEEQLGGWYTGEDGTLYVAGEDSREDWAFGSFYMRSGLGWVKRRTIPKAVHVARVVDWQGRLYAAFADDLAPPVSYPYVLVSADRGATWAYEPLAEGSAYFRTVNDVVAVPEGDASILYVQMYADRDRLYQFDGQHWAEVRFASGGFVPRRILAFQDALLVHGSTTVSTVFALRGDDQAEIPFLRGRDIKFSRFAEHDGWLYALLTDSCAAQTSSGDALFRTRDLATWEPLGCLTLPRTVTAQSISFLHDRLYLGAGEGAPGLYTAANASGSAVYTSAARVLDQPINQGHLFFVASEPPGTDIRFQIRSAQDEASLNVLPFVGPDGYASSAYSSSGAPLWIGHDGDTHVQLRAVLESQHPGLAPFLQGVTLVSRQDELPQFAVELSSSESRAGETTPVDVTSYTSTGATLSLTGSVALSARDAVSGELLPVQPTAVSLVNGQGSASVTLQQATETVLCITVGDITECSAPIQVQPGAAEAIHLTTDLAAPHPYWSPVGMAGEPFGLTLTVYDRYGNRATSYTGEVRCTCWRSGVPAQPALLTYTFRLIDGGQREFADGIAIGGVGEWAVTCHDVGDPGLAGVVTVRIAP